MLRENVRVGIRLIPSFWRFDVQNCGAHMRRGYAEA
jgi:hypothetical protein